MSDLQQRVPGQSLIEKLLSEWDAGRIRMDAATGRVEIADESISWFQGVLGERVTGRVLNQIAVEPGTTVLHSVPFGSRSADIDHVVITPAGVFVINTKDHENASIWMAGWGLRVNNRPQNAYIQSLVKHTRAVEARLSQAAGFAVPVIGMLAFVAPASFSQTAPLGDATTPPMAAAPVDRLVGELRGRRREMSDEQLDRVTRAALRPETWHDHPLTSRPGSHLGAEFDALYAEIGGAVLLRRADQRHERRERAAIVRETTRSGAGRGRGVPPRSTSFGASDIGAVPTRRPPVTSPTPATTWTCGSRGLALWPLLVVAAIGITSAIESIGDVASPGVFGLTALWALLIMSPLLFAAADLVELRRRGTDLGGPSVALALLGPLVHLSVRAVRLARRGQTGMSALITHLICGVAAVPILITMSFAAAVGR
ncbi:nuclease-related domain-containing protein [Schumannella sp. 10F1B-5-1]|uniref:nuclease-related domain-containing protein n=1 Tax=Schumannella sp. 10F1B-5-1 TaxID=2590780 RepID=UPI00113179C3|nr:nuclease-related domain-containing protein [Schumannella sp. 10F1B-5-1]TPW72853.1 NERD domain-containing protein [Schumannella sp. 10F1B-5-1]